MEHTGHLVRAFLPKTRLSDFMEVVRTSGLLLHECSLKKTSLEESFFNIVKGEAIHAEADGGTRELSVS